MSKIPHLEPRTQPLRASEPRQGNVTPYRSYRVRRRPRASRDNTAMTLLFFVIGGVAGIAVAYYIASLFPQVFAL